MEAKSKRAVMHCDKIRKDMQAFEKYRFALGMIGERPLGMIGERPLGMIGEQPRSTVKKVLDGAVGAVGKVGDIVAGLQEKRFKRGGRYKISVKKLNKDTVTDFVTACEAVLDMMTEIISCWERKEPELTRDEIFYLRSQLKSKNIIISFYGDSNVGKSTLLNSIMGDRYLPTNREAETAASVYIHFQQNDSSEISTEGNELQDDILYQRDPLSFIAEGANEIKVALRKKNKAIRNHMSEITSLDFLLKLTHQFGSTASSSQNFTMVDNPGCGEFNSGMIFASIKKAQDVTSAFVFVTSLETYRDGEISKFLKQVYSKNPEIVKQNCVTVVINKMDEALMPKYDEDSYTKETIISTVHEYLCNEVFSCPLENVPKASIIPVCGHWALLSRQYQKNQSDKKLLQFIHHEMRKLCIIEQFAEQKEYQYQHEYPVDDRVKLLEKSSNILELERRLKEITKDSFIWVQKMTADIEHKMDCLTSYLTFQIEKLSNDVVVLEDTIEQHYDIIQQVMKFYIKVNRGMKKCHSRALPTRNSTWKTFQRACEMDKNKIDEIQSTLEDEVQRTLENFKYTTKDKIDKGQHRQEDLETDLRESLESLLKKINYILTSRNIFCTLSEIYYQKTLKIHNRTLTLKNKLSRVLNQQGKTEETAYIPQIPFPKLPGPSLKIALNIPQQVNFFQKFLQFLRSLFRLPASSSSEYVEIEVGGTSSNLSDKDEEQSIQIQQLVEDTESFEKDALLATILATGSSASVENNNNALNHQEFSSHKGHCALDHDCDGTHTADDMVNCSDVSESSDSDDSGCNGLQFNTETFSSSSDYDNSKTVGSGEFLSFENSTSNLAEATMVSDVHNSEISLTKISYKISSKESSVDKYNMTPYDSESSAIFSESDGINRENICHQPETLQTHANESISHFVDRHVNEYNSKYDTETPLEGEVETTGEASTNYIRANEIAGVSSQKEISSEGNDVFQQLRWTSQEILSGTTKENDSESMPPTPRNEYSLEDHDPEELEVDQQCLEKQIVQEVDASITVTQSDIHVSSQGSQSPLTESTSRKQSHSEAREKSAYRKWTSQLEHVKNQIRADVLKEIHSFFADLETNVVMKYFVQHYEAACTILRQFDSYTVMDMETCKEKLNLKMFTLEQQRNTLEDLNKHKRALDEMRKKFEAISNAPKSHLS